MSHTDDLSRLLGAALQRRRWRTVGAIVRFAYAEGSVGAIDLTTGHVTWTYGGHEPTVRVRAKARRLPGGVMLLDRMTVLAALRGLGEVDEAIVRASEVQGRSAVDIARILTRNGVEGRDWSHDRVSRRLTKARRALAAVFEVLGYLDPA